MKTFDFHVNEPKHKIFLVINTTDYEGYASCYPSTLEDIESTGWDYESADSLEVGQMIEANDYKGAYLMRIA